MFKHQYLQIFTLKLRKYKELMVEVIQAEVNNAINFILGKKYVFDIERTLHEACDSVRRQLYEMETRREEDIPDDNDDDVQSENCEMSEDKQCNSQRCLVSLGLVFKLNKNYNFQPTF